MILLAQQERPGIRCRTEADSGHSIMSVQYVLLHQGSFEFKLEEKNLSIKASTIQSSGKDLGVPVKSYSIYCIISKSTHHLKVQA